MKYNLIIALSYWFYCEIKAEKKWRKIQLGTCVPKIRMVRSQQQMLTKSYKSKEKITILDGYNYAKLVYIASKIAPFNKELF